MSYQNLSIPSLYKRLFSGNALTQRRSVALSADKATEGLFVRVCGSGYCQIRLGH